ncbi:MAG: glutamyl-tRNA reductase [Campylobacterales bacterium]|nr:glutamyl-tRNA reductase [Campylobacterales bacterium]
MHYLVLSFSHKNSTLVQREKLAFVNDEVKKEMLVRINAHPTINESILLSTCNRIEIVCSCSHIDEATEHLLELLAEHTSGTVEELKSRADIFDDYGAIHHLFSVASSLDSMVVGETQILGQLKDAFRLCSENGYCGLKLSRALLAAQKCAAEIRNATDISSKPVSIASVAVSKARECVQSFQGKKVLVIGSGEMSVITCKHLSAHGASVCLMNRTRSKAEVIAHECGATVRGYEELKSALNEYTMVFTATGALSAIITDDMVKPVPFERYWFDMAVPRDIECESGNGIHVYRIDDLKEIVSANISMREDEARTSFVLVSRHATAFFEWLKALSIEPLIKNIYERAYHSAYIEAMRVIDKGFIPKEYEDELTKATEQALKRFLHPITEQMRCHTDPLRTDALIEALSFLMNDDQTPSIQKSHKGK